MSRFSFALKPGAQIHLLAGTWDQPREAIRNKSAERFEELKPQERIVLPIWLTN
jgi:hypothetical protein